MCLDRGKKMIRQNRIPFLRDMFSEYDYIMTNTEMQERGIYYTTVQKLVEMGLVKKVKRGYYHWIGGDGDSEIMMIDRLFPDAVLCMETALFYYQYIDQRPNVWHIAIDKNTSKQRVKVSYPPIRAYRVEFELLVFGESEGEIDNVKVRIYDRDRTICDVLRCNGKIEEALWMQAAENYLRDPEKNIPNLIRYAKRLRVKKRVKEVLGIEI